MNNKQLLSTLLDRQRTVYTTRESSEKAWRIIDRLKGRLDLFPHVGTFAYVQKHGKASYGMNTNDRDSFGNLIRETD